MSTTEISRILVIKNPQGLHARPAEMFARTAMRFESQVEVVHFDQRVDGKSILHLLTLGADEGAELLLEVRGADAQQAAEELAALVENHFSADRTDTQN